MNNWLAKFALGISIIALALSLWTYLQADYAAGRALKQREQELVSHYAPGVQKFCTGFGINAPQNPNSIDELLAPLVAFITRVNE